MLLVLAPPLPLVLVPPLALPALGLQYNKKLGSILSKVGIPTHGDYEGFGFYKILGFLGFLGL